MKTVKAGFDILERAEERGNLAVIEQAARTCYKSEGKIKADGSSAEAMVKGLIRSHHEAMLEHGDYIFEVTPDIYEMTARALQKIRNSGWQAPMLEMTAIMGRPIVSGNLRAWRELIAMDDIGRVYMPFIDPIYLSDIDRQPYPRREGMRQMLYGDLRDVLERETHIRATARFIVDRGVSHEFVRHRRFSFAQESTRYCNYSQDKFGGEITFVRPCFLAEWSDGARDWADACSKAEEMYFRLLDYGYTPQEARAVLPNSLKTELVMTGTLRDWKHFFSLRALGTTGAPHPQAKEVAEPLMTFFQVGWPDVFPSHHTKESNSL